MVAMTFAAEGRPSKSSARLGGRRLSTGVALAVAGALAACAAVGGLLAGVSHSTSDAVRTVVAVEAVEPTITTTERGISVVTQVYEPGQSSGWHVHDGVHAVAVLAGVLTVYDDRCRAATFGAGQPYVGGRGLHLVRNESDAPVAMVVTYVSPTRPGDSTRGEAAPAACAAPAG